MIDPIEVKRALAVYSDADLVRFAAVMLGIAAERNEDKEWLQDNLTVATIQARAEILREELSKTGGS